ncbi:uncharacterized protein RB166_005773 [Leptodactylus fuscus]
MFQDVQIERLKRVSKPTQKIRENFEITKEEFCDNLDELWRRTEHYIAALSRHDSDAAKLVTTLNRLSAAYERHQRLSAKYVTFLSNAEFDDAIAELTERENLFQTKDAAVKNARDKAELRIAHLQEVRSHRSTSSKHTLSSSRSSRSRRSALHDKLIEIRADAEEASVRRSFAEKEAEMAQRQAEAKAEMAKKEAETEAQLKILQMEREEAAALAKLKVLEQALDQDADLDCSIPAEVEDPADPTLLTQKLGSVPSPPEELSSGNIYRKQWKHVQHLANCFWSRWKKEYLALLQGRRKWQQVKPNLQVGDVVLMKDQKVERNAWPMGLISKIFPSEDGRVRKVEVTITRQGDSKTFIRPVSETVLLLPVEE